LDRPAVDEHSSSLHSTCRGPARDREQDGVQRVPAAVLDPYLPALAVERDDVGARERHEIADEQRGSA
jgi:hypothetical protein